MIRVHHLNNSRSQRVLWLLEELELPYEIVAYARDAKTMLAPDTLKAVHPLGKSPVIQDGALTLAETGLIVEYLVDCYGQGRLSPERGSGTYWRYAYWLHYAEGSLMTPLILKLVLNRLGLLGRPARGFVDAQLKLHFDYLEGELATSPWFAGPEFSAADIMMSFPLEAGSSRAGVDAVSKPNLHGFLERIHARPAYQRALEKGGKYAYARPSPAAA
ncbi:glutathione S-transferase [Caulobacter sp. S45]|uniref:glutathione S-transferase n=1 Tax=Caulobacter sp. S45 TaxID=1641861 RepID=UPI00131C645F|nr:glutathione S-transferase [Caulobacter sp. S45]